MEIHQLSYVLGVARHLHFSNAANELGVTQPTLSQQIDKLEKELGVRLFVRRTRSVELTLAGEEFLLQANKVLAEWDMLGEVMRKHALPKKKNIRVGTCTNFAPFKLAAFFMEFEKNHPSIKFHIVEKMGTCELVKLLQDGDIDAAFLMPSPNIGLGSSLVSHPLISGKVVVITSLGHHLAQKSSVTLHDVTEEKLIFPSRDLSLYHVILRAFKTNGIIPKIVGESSLVDSIVDLVAQDYGISLLSSQFADLISRPDVAVIPLEPSIERKISFVYLSPNVHLSVLNAFSDFILKTFRYTA